MLGLLRISEALRARFLSALVTFSRIFSSRLQVALHRCAFSFKLRWIPFSRKFSRKLFIFNLDCHVSVIADLRAGLSQRTGVRLVSWSLSRHNGVFRRYFEGPDPVSIFGSENWQDISPEKAEIFRQRYRRFLRAFDGFVVTYPIPFVELFIEFEKPILAVGAIRYEHPYSEKPLDWERLDESLKYMVRRDPGLLVANNQGDADYMEHFLGVRIPVVPSVCDYIRLPSSQSPPTLRLIQAKSVELERYLEKKLGPSWKPKREALGNRYRFEALGQVEALLYIPYNSSTMTLFELATLGIPVFIPSRRLLRELSQAFGGVMSELVFLPDGQAPFRKAAEGFPGADPRSPAFEDWWLDRADFYNPTLMPNVLVFDSFADPRLYGDLQQLLDEIRHLTDQRNLNVRARRNLLLEHFINRLRAGRSMNINPRAGHSKSTREPEG